MLRRKTGDGNLDQNTDSVSDALVIAGGVAIVRGRLIEGLSMPAGVDVDILHKLGRVPKGWIIVDNVGPAATGRFERRDDAVDRKLILRLRATGWGATIIVSVWVF